MEIMLANLDSVNDRLVEHIFSPQKKKEKKKSIFELDGILYIEM